MTTRMKIWEVLGKYCEPLSNEQLVGLYADLAAVVGDEWQYRKVEAFDHVRKV